MRIICSLEELETYNHVFVEGPLLSSYRHLRRLGGRSHPRRAAYGLV